MTLCHFVSLESFLCLLEASNWWAHRWWRRDYLPRRLGWLRWWGSGGGGDDLPFFWWFLVWSWWWNLFNPLYGFLFWAMLLVDPEDVIGLKFVKIVVWRFRNGRLFFVKDLNLFELPGIFIGSRLWLWPRTWRIVLQGGSSFQPVP